MKRTNPPQRKAIASSDIDVLGRKVPGFHAERYFDQQAERASDAAARRWPRLATWVGYAVTEPRVPRDKED
jgi:hypothetical protein